MTVASGIGFSVCLFSKYTVYNLMLFDTLFRM